MKDLHRGMYWSDFSFYKLIQLLWEERLKGERNTADLSGAYCPSPGERWQGLAWLRAAEEDAGGPNGDRFMCTLQNMGTNVHAAATT
jgi:hypothetical protein